MGEVPFNFGNCTFVQLITVQRTRKKRVKWEYRTRQLALHRVLDDDLAYA